MQITSFVAKAIDSFNLGYDLVPYFALKCKVNELILNDNCVDVKVGWKNVLGMVLGVIREYHFALEPAGRDHIIDFKPTCVFYMETNVDKPYAKYMQNEAKYIGTDIHFPFKFEREALQDKKYKKFMTDIGLEIKPNAQVLIDDRGGRNVDP